MIDKITLYATATFGHGGKQQVSRITGGAGEKKDFAFKSEVIDTKGEPRNERSVAEVTYPGLFELRNVMGKKEKVDISYVVVCEVEGVGLQEFVCEPGEAKKIAKGMEGGKSFPDIVKADAEGWDFVAKAARRSTGTPANAETKKAIEEAAGSAYNLFLALPAGSVKKAFGVLRKLIADGAKASEPATAAPAAEGTTEETPPAFT